MKAIPFTSGVPLIASAYLVFVSGLLLGLAGMDWSATLGASVAGVIGLAVLRRGKLSGLALAALFAGAAGIAVAENQSRRSALPADFPREETEAGLLESARARAGRAIDRTFGADAPMAKALLIAERQQIPQEMNDAFVAAGLVHILSISGLHVGIIAAALALVLESSRLSRRVSALVTLFGIAVYVAILGAPPPAVRAAAMVGAVTLGKLSQRPTSPWALLAIGAFLPLLQPLTVHNLGYQLSVAGMAALIAGGSFARRWLKPRFGGFRLKMYRELSASLLATLVSAPLIAWAFGRVSLIGPIANIAATPIVVLLQPLLFLALLLAPIPPLAHFAADAAHPLLLALNGCAHFFATVPGAVVELAPSWLATVLMLIAVSALVVALVSRFPMKPLITAAGCCAAGIILPAPVVASGKLEMHMLDVGQGDAILLRTPRGNWILVDAGRAWTGGDAGRSVVIPYLKKRGGKLGTFILSHPHLDHVGGASTILKALDPASYWDAGFPGGNAAYRQSLEVATRKKIAWHRVHPGDSTAVDGVVLTFLGPDSTVTTHLKDANEASAVVLIRYGMVRILLTGDAEREEELWLRQNAGILLRADILKVGHHGSSTSSSDGFIAQVCPRVALISVGAGNSYGHPSRDVVAALRRLGALVLRTDIAGTIVARTDGKNLEIQTGEQHWEFSQPRFDHYSALRSSCQRPS